MKDNIPRKIAAAGGIFITLSGILNLILGIQIGVLIIFTLPLLYKKQDRRLQILGGLLTVILGHAGAVFGALYVGTVGVILCYVEGIWLLIIYLKSSG